jgi:hypothetical protein
MRCLAGARFRAALLLRTCSLLSLMGLTLPSVLFAQLPAARLHSVFPAGGKAGSKIEVMITGIDLDDADRLWFSDNRVTATQKMSAPGEFDSAPNPVANTFEITIPADMPTGAVECRAIGRFGITNPRFFAINHQNELSEAGGNNLAKTPMDLPIESIVNGRFDQNNADYYRLNLVAGQSLVIETWAQRLDSRAEIYITMLKPDGKEFARARFAEGRDPVLSITAPQDGAYIVSLRDSVFGGGPEHAYRVSAHTRPVVLAALPPIVQAGKRTTIEVFGYQLPGGKPSTLSGAPAGLMQAELAIRAPVDAASRHDLTFGGLTSARSAWVDAIAYHPGDAWKGIAPLPLLVTTLPIVKESAAPNSPIQTISEPCEVAGLFDSDRDEDAYEFDAIAGKAYSIEVQSNRLGWETDPALSLEKVAKDKDGNEQLANLNRLDDEPAAGNRRQIALDLSSDDPSIDFTPQEAMRVRVRVINQYADRGWRLPRPYRLRIEAKQPDFRVAVYPLTLGLQPNQTTAATTFLPRGGTATAQVVVDRLDGMKGEIRIRAEGLPQGVVCPEILIGEGQRNGVLSLIAAQDAPASVGRLTFIASADVDGVESQRQARCVAVTRGTDNRDVDPGAYRVSKDYVIAVTDRFNLPAAGQLSGAPMIETSLGATLELPVKVARQTDFKENIKFIATGLPGQVKPQEANLAGDQAEGKIVAPLNVNNTRPGIYAVTLRGETKTKFARNPDAVARVEASQGAAQKKIEQVGEEGKTATAALEKSKAEFAEGKRLADEAKAESTRRTQVFSQSEADAKQKQAALEQAVKAQESDAANTALKAAAEAAKAAAEVAVKAQAEAQAAMDEGAKLSKERDDKLAAFDAAQKAAEAAMKAAQEKAQRAAQFKQAIDKQVGDVKNANQPKDLNFAVISSPALVRIHPSPIFVESAPTVVTGAINGQVELPLKVLRKFGFEGDIEATLELPSGTKGISADKITFGKDIVDGKLICKFAADATPGDIAAKVKLKSKFNNLDVTTEQPVTLRVAKSAP